MSSAGRKRHSRLLLSLSHIACSAYITRQQDDSCQQSIHVVVPERRSPASKWHFLVLSLYFYQYYQYHSSRIIIQLLYYWCCLQLPAGRVSYSNVKVSSVFRFSGRAPVTSSSAPSRPRAKELQQYFSVERAVRQKSSYRPRELNISCSIPDSSRQQGRRDYYLLL